MGMEKAIATSGKKTSSRANLQAAASAAVSIPISAVESFLEVSAKVQPNPAPSSPSDAALCVLPADVLWAIHEKSRYHHAGRQVRLNRVRAMNRVYPDFSEFG